MGQSEANEPVPVAAIYCHCALVFNCEPANSEVQNGLWVPVCERCMQIAWHDGRRVRKLQRQNYDHEGRSRV